MCNELEDRRERGGGGVRVSGRDATDRCVEREDTRKVKFANMGLGLDDITMFVRFFLSCLNVEEYLFEITPILLHFRKYMGKRSQGD